MYKEMSVRVILLHMCLFLKIQRDLLTHGMCNSLPVTLIISTVLNIEMKWLHFFKSGVTNTPSGPNIWFYDKVK